jgi:hypothetical protein
VVAELVEARSDHESLLSLIVSILSRNRRPQSSITIASKVSDVHRGDDNQIAWLTDRGCASGEDNVSIKGIL